LRRSPAAHFPYLFHIMCCKTHSSPSLWYWNCWINYGVGYCYYEILMSKPVSVIVPVHNGQEHLARCLARLRPAMGNICELIVVDDGSDDNSAQIAASYGARVVRTEVHAGPATARNRGAAAARGDILLFLDADVEVYPDTISRIVEALANDPTLDAVIGSYDDKPQASNFMSQYRNLMHSFVHQSGKREAATFWAGCGAIRRQVFFDCGMFNELYSAPAIEDIELGYRLTQAGRRIALISEVRVKHLKRWSMRNVIKTDFFYRALPWSNLIVRSGHMPNDLNLRISQRISVALVFLMILLGAAVAIQTGAAFLIPLFVTFFILLSYYWLESSNKNHRLITGVMTGVMILIAALAWVSHVVIIIPLLLISWLALFTRHRYACPTSTWHRRTGALAGGYCLSLVAFVWFYLPKHPLGTAFLFVLLTLVAINRQFYLFLAGNRGRLFALAAIPFHFLYFLSSGLAFLCAVVSHVSETRRVPSAVTESADAPEKSLAMLYVLVCAMSALIYFAGSGLLLTAVSVVLRRAP